MNWPREKYFILFGLSQKENSWQAIYYLLILFLGSILFAAIVSPWVYWGFEKWNQFYPNLAIQYILDKGLDKTFDRLRWLPVLLFLPVLLWYVHLFTAKKLGLVFQSKHLLITLKWFLIGMGMFGVTAIIQYNLVVFDFRIGFDDFKEMLFVASGIIIKAFFAALIIGMIEEIVFRGMIFRFFYTAIRPELAVTLSALFFAWTHFKDIPKEIMEESITTTWASGFVVAFWTLLSFTQTLEWIPFLNLFLSGLILNLVFLKNYSLWPCVGLHTGWVFMLMLNRSFFRVKVESTSLWIGSHKMIDGLLTSSVLVLCAIILIASYRKNETSKMATQHCCQGNS